MRSFSLYGKRTACFFRDHIVKLFGFFPILNLFGPKGTGKTELAISLLQFFGNQIKGPNITNSKDEYSNDEKIKFNNLIETGKTGISHITHTNNGDIREDVDFRIIYTNFLKTDKFTTEVKWACGKNVLLINHSRIFAAYRIHGGRSKENVMPLSTLEYYLINCPELLGKKPSVSFKVEENKKVVEDTDSGVSHVGAEIKRTTRRITTAMAFDYDLLNISIPNKVDTVEVEQASAVPDEILPF